MQKWKKILLGDYPHRRITAVLLLLSVVIMCLVIRNDLPEPKETDVVTDSTGQRESVIEDEKQYAEGEESQTAEESVMEENGGEKEPEATPVLEEATDGEPQEPVTPEVTLEPEVSQSPEPEPVPDASRIPEPTQTPEVTPIPELIRTPEPTPNPERTPISEPEEKEPEPEATSTPHEHSWMFDSWYQEPTCSNGGLVMEICAHCGETQVTGGTPTGEHSYQVETPGDCISEEVVVCSVCNCREVREKNPGNHIDVEDGFCYGCGKNAD